MDFFNQAKTTASSEQYAYNEGLRTYMLKVYNYMCLALCITGFVAMGAASSPEFVSMIYSPTGGITGFGILVSFIAPLGIVFAIGAGLQRFSLKTIQTLFIVYSVVMGISLSNIFLVFTGESIARIFFITAITFGLTSLYGYTTKKDLSAFGSFLFMGLIGVVIISLFNMFFKSSALMFISSIAGLFIFIGLVAYDTQKLRNIYFMLNGNAEGEAKMSIMGALDLYISFINIFITLLQLFGSRRD